MKCPGLGPQSANHNRRPGVCLATVAGRDCPTWGAALRTAKPPSCESEQRLSRRDLIKKGVVTGGIVWAAPVIMTSPAFAAGTAGTPPVRNCAVFVCGDVPDLCSPPRGPCVKIGTVEGDCVCVSPLTSCNLPACSSSTDCPPGSACTGPGCCGGPALCAPIGCAGSGVAPLQAAASGTFFRR